MRDIEHLRPETYKNTTFMTSSPYLQATYSAKISRGTASSFDIFIEGGGH